MARILLIDDDPLTLDVVGRMITEMGHTVCVAPDGAKGIALIERQPVDLVITDLLMPIKEGIETLREIRTFHPSIRLVAISGGHGGGSGSVNLHAAGHLGADAVLQKPFTPAQLLDVIGYALKQSAEGPPQA